MDSDLANRMEILLQAEREALIAGDLGRISLILQEKRTLAEALSTLAGAPAALAPLRERLQSNNGLYDAALSGIRRVVERLGTLQEMRKSLETYDSNGKRQSISHVAEHRLEKRA